MKLSISDDCYNYLESKYGNLIKTICKNISGDPVVLSSHEDNAQELFIKCIEAAHAFSRKIEEEDFSKFIRTREFDQYIKTCLWNLKNSTGNTIVKNRLIYKTMAIGVDDVDQFKKIEVDDSYSHINFDSLLSDISKSLDIKLSTVLNYIILHPKVLKASGRINIKKLSGELGITWVECKKIVCEIEDLLIGGIY